MKNSFTEELLNGRSAASINRSSRRSASWLQNIIKRSGDNIDPKHIVKRPFPGRMYQFVYHPKGLLTLPYYDRNPLVLVIDITPKGFTGLNLHYLEPKVRAHYFDKIYHFTSRKDPKVNDIKTRMRFTWAMINSNKYKESKAIIKQYRYSQLRSQLMLIPADQWGDAIMLPTSRFTGVSKTKVYNDSRRIYT